MERLRTLALAVDARGRSGADGRPPKGSVAIWRGLAEGRWSLVDEFEEGSRRYLVVRRAGNRAVALGRLSSREQEIVGHVANGYSNKHIAFLLGLSTSTVATYLRRAMHKLGMSSRVQLVGRAVVAL